MIEMGRSTGDGVNMEEVDVEKEAGNESGFIW